MSTIQIDYAPDELILRLLSNSNGWKIALDNNYSWMWEKGPTFEVDEIGEAAAEEVFDLFNNPSRDEEKRKYGHRSVSVGDIVIVDNVSYYCNSIGWNVL